MEFKTEAKTLAREVHQQFGFARLCHRHKQKLKRGSWNGIRHKISMLFGLFNNQVTARSRRPEYPAFTQGPQILDCANGFAVFSSARCNALAQMVPNERCSTRSLLQRHIIKRSKLIPTAQPFQHRRFVPCQVLCLLLRRPLYAICGIAVDSTARSNQGCANHSPNKVSLINQLPRFSDHNPGALEVKPARQTCALQGLRQPVAKAESIHQLSFLPKFRPFQRL